MGGTGQLMLADASTATFGVSAESALASAEQALLFLRESPWTPTAAATLALGIGLSLWLAGARIARPAMITACAITGALAVAAFADALGAEPVWLWMVGGLVVGAVAGMIVFRLAVAGVIALTLGLAAPAAAAVVQNINLIPDTSIVESSGDAMFLDGVPLEGEAIAAATAGEADSLAHAALDRVAAFTTAVSREARLAWQALPERDRMVLAGSALGGVFLGLAIGLFWPRASAAAVTSALGAAIWLPAGVVLLQRTSGTPEWLPVGGMSALGTWLGVTIAGTMLQSAMMTRRRAKSKIVHVHRHEQPAAA